MTIIVLIVLLSGCSNEPDVLSPSDDVNQPEVSSDGWIVVEKWDLLEMSPGVWFDVNTAAAQNWHGQYLNVITDIGRPESVLCYKGNVRLIPSPSVETAVLVRCERGDEEMYELVYPSPISGELPESRPRSRYEELSAIQCSP
jgi:hypothetical protein